MSQNDIAVETTGYTPPIRRFPLWTDSSAMSTFKECEQAGYYGNILRLVLREPNPHFRAGGAYASAHEMCRNLIYGPKRLSVEDAVALSTLKLIKEYGAFDPSPDMPQSAQAKTWIAMSEAFIRYYTRWPPASDWCMPDMSFNGVSFSPSNEFSFAIPLPINHPETGDPILFAGKADMRVRVGGNGCWNEFKKTERTLGPDAALKLIRSWPLYIFDDKTTHQMGPTWARQWTFRGQFMGYAWANNQIAQDPWDKAHGAIVSGAGIQKTQTKTDRVQLEIAQWKIDDWYRNTMYWLQHMIDCWNADTWPKQWDSACTSYGGCDFQDLCDTPRPDRWMSNYKESTWNPVPTFSKEND